MRKFKNKKMLRKQEIIKYIFILLVVYYSLKFSFFILIKSKVLYYTFDDNKLSSISNYISSNTFNKPLNLLRINNIKRSSNPLFKQKEVVTINEIRPSVYMYNSHPGEKYLENNKSVYDMNYIFQEELNNYNVDVFIEDGDINNFLLMNNLDYGYSYIASRNFIEGKILNNNYNLIIDLHRDATAHDDTYINVNNIPCVKVLFVVGMLNSDYESNYNLALNLNDLINSKYPNLSRGVMLKSGPNVNGLYNQDLSPNMILLELGGNNNTEDEVINTIKIISPIIADYLNGNQSI